MLPSKLFAVDFPPTTYADWRQRVEQTLVDVPFDKALVERIAAGLDVEPLYPLDGGERVADSAASGLVTARQPGWQVVAEIGTADLAEARRALQQALNLGVGQLWLKIDPAAQHGMPLVDRRDFETLLDGVDPQFVAIQVEAGHSAQDWSQILTSWASGANCSADLRGGLGADPLGALAHRGGPKNGLDLALDQWVALARRSLAEAPQLRAGLVSTVAYHEAGATAVEELAYAIATGTLYLRRLVDAGTDINSAASQLLFAFSVGSDTFVEIAKLRAARLLWAKILGAGGASRAEMRLHARTSQAAQTVRHSAGNWLRATGQGFAAASGGADSLAVLPYDSVLGEPSSLGQRLSLTLQHVLAEEAHLGRVADPAAGSWYLESLTDGMARAAWDLFQQIEAGGGMGEWLLSGKVRSRLDEQANERRRAVAQRRQPIVGVSKFVSLDEPTAVKAPTTATEEVPSQKPAGDGDTRHFGALAPVRWSEPFESLRDAAERQQGDDGPKPQVFLANLGSAKEHGARTGFARDLLAAGGLQAIPGPSDADDEAILDSFGASGSRLAVLCGTDAAYVEQARVLAGKLIAAGASQVWIAGSPGKNEREWREVGISGFLHLGGDALASLNALHAALGIGESASFEQGANS